MGMDDKIANKTETATGKVKETVGDATNNENLKAEGQADQVSGKLKDAGEKVKDAFNKATDR